MFQVDVPYDVAVVSSKPFHTLTALIELARFHITILLVLPTVNHVSNRLVDDDSILIHQPSSKRRLDYYGAHRHTAMWGSQSLVPP
jgi:hypothetical protein